jgi:hypothetical protein
MTMNGDRPTPPHGMPARRMLEAHEGAIDELQLDMTSAKEGVARLEVMVGGMMAELGDLSRRVDDLSVDVRHALRLASSRPPPPIPSMRAELPSKIDMREFAYAVKNLTLEGERRPDTTPDEQVDQFLERVIVRKAGRGLLRLGGLIVAAATSSIVTYLLSHPHH